MSMKMVLLRFVFAVSSKFNVEVALLPARAADDVLAPPPFPAVESCRSTRVPPLVEPVTALIIVLTAPIPPVPLLEAVPPLPATCVAETLT